MVGILGLSPTDPNLLLTSWDIQASLTKPSTPGSSTKAFSEQSPTWKGRPMTLANVFLKGEECEDSG